MNTEMSNQPVHRTGIARRALLRRVSAVAATTVLTLGLGAATPLLAAKNESKKDKESGKDKKGKKDKEDKDAEDEKQGGKTVTRTFSSQGAVVINDDVPADPYPATIQVSGFKKGKVVDVNVILRGLNHGFPDNIDAVLIAPNGAGTVLMSDVGAGTDASSLTLTLDDEAAAPLPAAAALSNGSFKPFNDNSGPDTYPSLGVPPTSADLSLLDGGNPNGEWRLFMLDDAAANVGALSGGWDLVLTVKLKKKKGGKK